MRHYKEFNINPKGRKGCDCVVRAIALALDMTWEQVVREMTELGIKKGLVLNDDKLYPVYLKEKGFSQWSEPRDYDNRKITVNEAIDDKYIYSNMTIVANVGSHHVTCIKNGTVYDIWDCSGRILHKYWVRGSK